MCVCACVPVYVCMYVCVSGSGRNCTSKLVLINSLRAQFYFLSKYLRSVSFLQLPITAVVSGCLEPICGTCALLVKGFAATGTHTHTHTHTLTHTHAHLSMLMQQRNHPYMHREWADA